MFKNKNVLVYGLGDSGRAVIDVLKKLGAHFSFYDDDMKYLEYVGFEKNPLEKEFDFCIVSPGVKVKNNKILQALEKKTKVLSEIDFAYLLCKGKIVAVTGTNGKTTVCMLTKKLLESAGYDVFLCGNVGLPFSSVCLKMKKNSVAVVEVSSFQLETSKIFRPNVAAILNVKPDHLDRHGSFEEYKNSKAKIAQNMNKKDVLLLNFDDEISKRMIVHKNFYYFSKKPQKRGFFVKNSKIYINKKPVFDVQKIPLKGEKNLENVLACVGICSFFNVKNFDAIENFRPAKHRMEIVGTKNGVTYVDDSKATNVASTLACEEAFGGKSVILLLGGHGKDIEYDEIFKFPLKSVMCFGEEGQKIFEYAKRNHVTAFFREKFDDAVKFCIKNARAGDFVLLSPACSSFDEFSSYSERGERFKTLILESDDEKT